MLRHTPHRQVDLFCLILLAILCRSADASPCPGQIIFSGQPVPGVTVTAEQGAKRVTVLSDERGVYHFAVLQDGVWQLEVSLTGFEPLQVEVTVSAQAAPRKLELTMQTLDELKKIAGTLPPDESQPPLRAGKPKSSDSTVSSVPVEIPNPEEDQNQQNSDGLLVNGSVNNAATSQSSLDRAFGNQRSNTKSLYNGARL